MKRRIWSRALLVLVITQCLFLSAALAWFPPPPPGCTYAWTAGSYEYGEGGPAETDCFFDTCDPEWYPGGGWLIGWDTDEEACACICCFY